MIIYNPIVIDILTIICLFVIPPLLFYFNLVKYKYRFYALTGITIIAINIVLLENWTLADLGFRLDNFVKDIIPYVIFTIAISILLIVISRNILKRDHKINWWTNQHLLWGFIPISFLQEFLFRSFLIPLLHNIFISAIVVVLINALLFVLIHVIYKHTIVDMLLVFLEGILLATMYMIYPNLLLIALAHSAHNFIAYYFNYFNQSKFN